MQIDADAHFSSVALRWQHPQQHTRDDDGSLL